MSEETRSDFGKTTRLVEVMQLGSDTLGVLDLPPKFLPVAGQYLPCRRLTGGSEILVTPLFRVIGSEGSLSVGPLPSEWLPGDILSYLPPAGKRLQATPICEACGTGRLWRLAHSPAAACTGSPGAGRIRLPLLRSESFV